MLFLAARASSRPLRAGTRLFSSKDWSGLEERAARVTEQLDHAQETVSVAEWTTGGLISAAIWSSSRAHRIFKGSGVRLTYGVNRAADQQGIDAAHQFVKEWGLIYEHGIEQTESGTPVHALELAHAAKFNLGTVWGIGESSIPGPEAHPRTGLLPGMGFVAVAGARRLFQLPRQSTIVKESGGSALACERWR